MAGDERGASPDPAGDDTPPFVLVVGGARSGKSRYAEALAAGSGRSVVYVATAGAARDAEMAERIATHRARRSADWVTVDAQRDLAAVVADKPDGTTAARRQTSPVVLIDCITLWLSNLMLADGDVAAELSALVAAVDGRSGPIVAVTNEVGEGIVPMTPLGRAFRDQQGFVNQALARSATRVVLMVAGCPLLVKPAPTPPPL